MVSVNVIRRQRIGPRSLWEEWFVPFGYEREVAGLGSGLALAPGGYVLTNAHVVDGATEIVVVALDGNEHPAELLGSDPLSDLALLKVEAEIPVPEFGDSDGLVIGEPAIAIGNPFGYLLSNVEPTVTVGVISGTGRHILSSAFSGSREEGRTIYADMIQTDASINPGNSGGPLVNGEGRVIGVNSTIFSRTGGSQGLGFAIPINRALLIAQQLRENGQVRRPWVGLDVGPAESDRTVRRRGARIVRVAPGSPAQRADLTPGLELVAVQDRRVKSPLDWEAEMFNVVPGQSLTVTVRDEAGAERRVVLEVEDLPSVRADRIEVLEGLELISLTPAIRAERDLSSREGALIVNVSDEVARVTGLRRGDLILGLNQRRVASADEVAEMLDYLAGRGALRLYYERNGAIWSTTFRIVEE
ncbi:MAG: PDZ domain-containing protein [Gemmatimonadetes bacterium]|uniref:PDZ domain-containing protein n=1 Tax=Candidatus Kutchimonas denitrificans TaxID=3056748 RepID=A0AAE4Z8T7_9BACT|nr:PDZ domain-containing protein [Gemmatimonadota bacterium]NIR74602.1 PDZ domain-containing protein [Candidatus Kutchimonas denitrificans]NIS02792.1 PDZ domain-containing protein [Gemmatimonadota bacterium]NIT68953.1 PDZ domain-containing protein [Gemmatimonadota bacterium]NIU52258.1 PDZ domain-containing protein [Gemmatimonadota bacterium]